MKVYLKKQNFLQGALILVVASMIVKVFGAIFKIPLTNIIGVTAMAYFNTAYGFYVIFYMISTAGIPVALSKMISEAEAKGRKIEISKIFKVSYTLFFIIGLIGSLMMTVFSKEYSAYVHLNGLHYSIIAISTTLFFMCITSAYRGYFQGLKNMKPTAVSQVIGASGKLFVGLIVAAIAVKNGLPDYLVAALTLLGITTGSIGSTIYLAIYKKICDKKDTMTLAEASSESSSSTSILKKLISIAIPITLSATILSLTNTIDTTLMVGRLVSSGVLEAEATKIMGAYTSMAVPLNNLSPNLIYPFAISVMPAITSMFVEGKRKEAGNIITSTLRMVSIIALPCSFGLSVFSRPIISLLYSSKETILYNGEEILAVDVAADMLSILAVSVFFIAMVSVTNAVLQSYGHENKTIISTSLGILFKIILNYVLIGMQGINIYGAPIATLTCYFVIMLFNFYFIAKYTDYVPKIVSIILRPLFSAAVSVGIGAFLYSLISNKFESFSAIIAILFTVIIYFSVIFAVKGIVAEDIRMLPRGEKIEKILKKVKVIK